MRSLKGPALAALFGAAVLVLPPKGPVALIRVPKVPGPVEPLLAALGVDVRQELGACYLALAESGELAGLRKAGLRFTVLDRAAGRREAVVVRLDAPATLDALRLAGTAVVAEPGAAVFWAEEGSTAGAVPNGLAFKPLSPRTIAFRAGPAVSPRPAVPAAAADPVVEALAAQVAAANLSATVQDLQDFQTRHTSTTGCRAAGEYLFGAFTALGLENVRFETFGPLPGSRNVVAEKTGETFPDDLLIVCAHYDSTSGSYQTLAPGADDNASGSAAVVEAARVLAAVPLDFTVRFALFSGEEQGLHGSRAHAAAARASGERIVGVVNMDMIGHASAPPASVDVYVNRFSSWLGDRMAGAAASYGGPAANRIVDPSMVYSDHAPFWDAGAAALLAIESDFSPYYHSVDDTLDKLDPAFFTGVAKASLGLLAELAQPVREGHPRAPAGLQSRLAVYTSLFNRLTSAHLTWTAQADAAGYNVYRSDVSHVGYVRLNAAPVGGTSFVDGDIPGGREFYYVVTAVGAAGLESNRSQETCPFLGGAGSAVQAPPGLLRFLAGGWR